VRDHCDQLVVPCIKALTMRSVQNLICQLLLLFFKKLFFVEDSYLFRLALFLLAFFFHFNISVCFFSRES
jgi:hypothetical protein